MVAGRSRESVWLWGWLARQGRMGLWRAGLI